VKKTATKTVYTSSTNFDEGFEHIGEAFAKIGKAFEDLKEEKDGVKAVIVGGTVNLFGPIKNVIIDGRVIWTAPEETKL